MSLMLSRAKNPAKASHYIYLVPSKGAPKNTGSEVLEAARLALKSGQKMSQASEDGKVVTIVPVPVKTNDTDDRESIRNAGANLVQWLNSQKFSAASVVNATDNAEVTFLLAEGMALANYTYTELFSEPEKKQPALKKVALVDAAFTEQHLSRLKALVDAVCFARDLINKPLSHLTAVQLADAVAESGKANGFNVEIFNKQKISALKMGGLLAVNKGSVDPPTFTIAEYKPKKVVNSKPLILVGKGVVYDTGGMSLKPTPNSMDFMKSDMAGAAAMIGTIQAIAALKLPVHVVALIPATDNRPDGNAYVPGDVITMYNGTTVEVKNTDAEGRLLLADALSYAKKYDPELVIDAATLTGASVRAIGTYATSLMGTAAEKALRAMEDSGYATYERIVRFPLWKEYGEELKSTVADLSNLGKGEGGQISAGKFLEHFTSYPWMHLDIAGPAYLHSPLTYRTAGGTGVGVRLLVDFVERYYQLNSK